MKAALRAWGYQSVFLDFDPADGIPAGRAWERDIYARLRQCRAMIVLCSARSMASPWCFAEITHAKALGKAIFPVKVAPCDVHALLSPFQALDLTIQEPAARAQALDRLAAGLRAAGLDPRSSFALDPARPPYPGLMAFQEEDAAVFFGRQRQVDRVVEALQRMARYPGPRLLLVLGASGSGKSSLVRAGVIPRLRRGAEGIVAIDPFRPLQRPEDQLAMALATTFARHGIERDLGDVRATLDGARDAPARALTLLGLADELRVGARAREAQVLVVVDQAEELLGPAAGEQAPAFLGLLRTALDAPSSPFLVVATLRSDFLADWQQHPALRDLPCEPITVEGMSPEDFHAVITGPATVAGLDLEAGLPEALMADTGTSDSLPLLAFALRELWERRGDQGRLTLTSYRDDLKRLEGSVARAADALLPAAAPGSKPDPGGEAQITGLRRALTEMVRVNDAGQYVRKPAAWADLPAESHALLERFVAARLLVSRATDDGKRVLEVAHEALFRSWKRLVDWLAEDRDFLLWRQRLAIARAEWLRGGQDESALPRGPALAEAERWLAAYGERLNGDEKTFVAAGVAAKEREAALRAQEAAARDRELARQRAARRLTIGGAGVLVVVIASVVVVAVRQGRRAAAERAAAAKAQHAELARRLASDADRQLDDTADGLARSALFAIESLQEQSTIEGFRALARALSLLPRRPERVWKAHEGDISLTMTSPDGRRLATADPGGVAVWDLPGGGLRFRVNWRQPHVPRLAFSRDGRWLAGPCDQGACAWDMATGATIGTLPNREQPLALSFGGPHSDWLAIAWYHGRTRLHRTTDWGQAAELDTPEQHMDVALSGDGKLLVTRGATGKSQLWQVGGGQPVPLPHAAVARMARGADGDRSPGPQRAGWAAAGEVAADVDLYTLRAGFWLNQPASIPADPVIGHLTRVGLDDPGTNEVSVALSPLTVRDRSRLRHEIVRTTEKVSSASVVDDARLAAGVADGRVIVWPLDESGWDVARLSKQPPLMALAFSMDGRHLAAATGGAAPSGDAPGGVRIYDVVTLPSGSGFALRDQGPLPTTVPGRYHESGSSAIAWSRSGRWLAVKTAAGVDVIDPEARALIRQVPLAGQDPARLLVSSPDDRWLFVCAANDTVSVIDTSTWRARPPLVLTSHLASLAFSPSGLELETRTRGSPMHRVPSRTAQVQRWSLAGSAAPQALAGSSGDGGGPGEDTSTWPTWAVEDQILTSVDGAWVMDTGDGIEGKLPRVTDAGTKEAVPLEVDRSDPNDFPKPWVMSAAFSPDARWLAAARSDRGGMLRLWPLRPADLIAEGCARVGRNLDPSEWPSYLERPFHATCANLPVSPPDPAR